MTMSYGISPLDVSDLRILVIETNNTSLNTSRQLLSSIGMNRPDYARTVVSAKKKVMEGYDLVICDYNIGVNAGGKELIEMLREENRHSTSFILMLSDHSRDAVVSALECHPDDLLLKPYKMDDFKRRVRNVAMKHLQTHEVRRLLDIDDWEPALRILNQYIVEKRISSYWCLKRKLDLYDRKNMHRQLEDYASYILTNENIEWVRTALIDALFKQKKYNTAIIEAEKAIEKFPYSIKSHTLMGDCYFQLGEFQKAYKHHVNASSISSHSIETQKKLAKSQHKIGLNSESISILNRVVRIAENTLHDKPDLYLALAGMHQVSGKHGVPMDSAIQDAVNVMNKAMQKFPDDKVVEMSAQCYQAHSFFINGMQSEAWYRMRKLEDEFHDVLMAHPESRLNMALTLCSIGDKEKAKKIIKEMENDQSINDIDMSDFIGADDILEIKDDKKNGLTTTDEVKIVKLINDLKYDLKSVPCCTATNIQLLNTYIHYIDNFYVSGSITRDFPVRLKNAKKGIRSNEFSEELEIIEKTFYKLTA